MDIGNEIRVVIIEEEELHFEPIVEEAPAEPPGQGAAAK